MNSAGLSFLVIFSAVTLSTRAATPEQWNRDYQTLQKWQYSAAAIPLTAPITITRDTATWTLTSGTVRLAQPTSAGRVTGLVFEGTGRFTMTIPDRFELAQLRRFAAKPSIEKLDEQVTEMVLRVSDDTIDRLFPEAKVSGYAPDAVAAKRQNHWLIDLTSDVDARVITAMINPGEAQFTAGFRTATYDWLTYDYDSSRTEEIQLYHFDHIIPESWISLDRPEDRDQDGRPGTRRAGVAALRHIDVKADLTKYGSGRAGETEQRMINGHYTVEEEFQPQAKETGAIVLTLHPEVQNLSARDVNGTPLVILRDHIGARSMNIDNKIYDSSLTVILNIPAKVAEPLRLTFEYDLELPNYAPGNLWYPTLPEAFDDHTARLQLLINRRNEVRSMGRLENAKEDERGKTTIWIVDKPTKMITFSTAEHFQEVVLDVAGIPQVVSFGWSRGLDVGARVRNSGADVANSLQFFQQMFDDPIGGDGKFSVTSIVGNHGQAFDGFLHLAEGSYSEHPGASELFRAHEVAHEWFGHRVGWRSYRDQWLSEALAEYAAMFFVKATVRGGEGFFREILRSYDSVVKGNLAGGFSKFNRPWLIERSASARSRMGPIGHGDRAATSEVPFAYLVQTYLKGPLVVHMLREILLFRSRSDEIFEKILRDFIKEYSGKLASSADFQHVIERNAPGDWSWFFNDWIYGAEIPSLRWSYRVEPHGDKYKLTMTVKRSDTSPDFVVVAPVRLEFDGGKFSYFFFLLKDSERTMTFDIPARPRNVLFAPDYSLLANIRKE